MKVNKRLIIGGLIITVFIIVGFFSFMDSKIEYADFKNAAESNKICQVKGVWQKNKETVFDANTNKFTFYMTDESNQEMKVILDGARPNNFELASHVVAKGKVEDGYFHAREVLTKCPSKYEGQGEDVLKSGS